MFSSLNKIVGFCHKCFFPIWSNILFSGAETFWQVNFLLISTLKKKLKCCQSVSIKFDILLKIPPSVCFFLLFDLLSLYIRNMASPLPVSLDGSIRNHRGRRSGSGARSRRPSLATRPDYKNQRVSPPVWAPFGFFCNHNQAAAAFLCQGFACTNTCIAGCDVWQTGVPG